jgi:hypothetical protein
MIETLTVTNVLSGRSFTFNDDNCPLNQWTMDIDLRSEDRERPMEHGLYPSYTYYGRRIYHGEGALLDDTPTGYMQRRLALQSALILPPRAGIREPFQLDMRYAGIVPSLRAMCTLDSAPELPMAVPNWSLTEFFISFKAFDPIIYSAQTLSTTANTPVITAGVAFPLTFPIAFFGTSGSAVLSTNNGNILTYPTVTIYGPITNPRLFNVAKNEIMRFDGLILNAGDAVTVDFKDRVALSSAGGNAYGSITNDSTFWTLDPGDNQWTFTADAAASPSRAVMTWNDAYML